VVSTSWQEHRPTPVARWLLRLTVLAVPRGAIRDRYREEFVMEIGGLPRRSQVRQAASLLIASRRLRVAINEGCPRPAEQTARDGRAPERGRGGAAPPPRDAARWRAVASSPL